MEIAQDLGGIGETAGREKGLGDSGIVEDIGGGEEELSARFVGLLQFLKEDDEIFENLAPGWEMLVSQAPTSATAHAP